jgi:hypothetical protein
MASNAKIVRSIRTAGTVFRVEEPISEIFKKMRFISEKVKTLRLHPIYLSVSYYFRNQTQKVFKILI